MIYDKVNINSFDDKLSNDVLSDLDDFFNSNSISFLNDSSLFRLSFFDYLKNKAYTTRYKISPFDKISITAKKKNTGICLQLGNTARFHSDLLKLEYIFSINNKFQSILIIPTYANGNRAYLERAIKDIEIFKNFIKVPIKLIAINN